MTRVTFKTVVYTPESLAAMSTPALAILHNDLLKALKSKVNPVNRFADKPSAIKRVTSLLQEFAVKFAGSKPAATPVTPSAPAKAAPVAAPKVAPAPVAKPSAPKPERQRVARGTNLQPQPQFPVVACREGSKQAILVDLLKAPRGASMAELIAGLSGGRSPWQEATVRSGFGWDLKRKGYGVESRFDSEGGERFVLIVPVGAKIPAHKPTGKK